MSGFSAEQMEQLRTAFREELADAGLRIDGPEHVDDAREDFRFLRHLRKNFDVVAKRIGSGILNALIVVGLLIAGMGFWAWFGKGPTP